MTTTIKISTTAMKTLMLLLAMNLAFACSNPKTPSTEATAQTVAAAPQQSTETTMTIKGIVKKITNGKDGYTADVQTDNDGMYAALVSISNLGGPDNFKSCEVDNEVSFQGVSSVSGATKNLMVKKIISIEPIITTQFSIDPKGLFGIEVGDAIKKHSNNAKKTTIKTGEGSFVAYQIIDPENNPAGYFMPDPNNKLLVGDITIETPKASTDKGIKIGSTFQDLLKAYPNIEVHGSESEGRTYATANGFSFRLKVANFTYDVDKAKIPATTKITEIVINRK
jgi:hypothetical protein